MAAKPAHGVSHDLALDTDAVVTDAVAVNDAPSSVAVGEALSEKASSTASSEQPTRKRLVGLSAAEADARRERGEGNSAPQNTSRIYRRLLVKNASMLVNVILFAIVIFLVVLRLYGDPFITAILVATNGAIAIVVLGWSSLIRYLWQVNIAIRMSDWSIAGWHGLRARFRSTAMAPAPVAGLSSRNRQ